MQRRARTRRPGEAGFTIPELAVVAAVTLVVAVAVLSFIVISARQHLNQEDRVTATDDARNALLHLSSELRDAGGVTYVDSRTVEAQVRATDGTFHEVTFVCGVPAAAPASCTKTDATSGTEELIVDGVLNDGPFRLVRGSDVTATTSEGGAIEITLELQLEEANNPVSLTSAVTPRNCSDSAGVINPCA